MEAVGVPRSKEIKVILRRKLISSWWCKKNEGVGSARMTVGLEHVMFTEMSSPGGKNR
jgi:hypothetical protein